MGKYLHHEVKDAVLPKMEWMMGHDINFAFLAQILEVTTDTPGYCANTASIFMGALTLELHYAEPVCSEGVSELRRECKI